MNDCKECKGIVIGALTVLGVYCLYCIHNKNKYMSMAEVEKFLQDDWGLID